MAYNPYGAPAAQGPIAPPPQGPPGTPQPWEAGEVVSRAWDIVKVHWVPLVFGSMIASGAASAPQQIGSIYKVAAHGPQAGYPFEDPIWLALVVGGFLVGWVLQAFFQVGLIKMYLTAARGGSPEFSHVFSGGSRFLPMLGTMFLSFLLVAVGLMLLVVPGFIMMFGLFLAPYYVVERDMGPIEALKASWETMRGEKGKLFVLFLYWMGITLLGVLACCVGMLPAMAVVTLTQAIVYCRLTGTESGYGPTPPPVNPYGGYGGYGPPPQQPPGGFGYGPR